ncbi:MAG TPA: FxsA family protein [Thermoguttaceae bacterium]|nr:FxsA family protein [Thermoguttaceae bacterium]
MLLRLLLLFTIVPLIELSLLLWLAEQIQWGPTLGLVLLTGFLGAALARHEGLRCITRIQQKTAAGQLPGDPLLDGLMILVAGALLVTPGVLTDLVGFSLLVPGIRRIMKRSLKKRFQTRIMVATGFNGRARPASAPRQTDDDHGSHVIDVSSEELPDE